MEPKCEEHKKQLAREVYIEGGELILHVQSEYPIGLDRIDTPLKMMWWFHHLAGKGWFTAEHGSRMIELMAPRMGLKMYQGDGSFGGFGLRL